MSITPSYLMRPLFVLMWATLAELIVMLMTVGPARAAAPPTDGAGVLISTAPAGTVAGSVDAGTFHSCGVKSDGTRACWGDNSFGQLGAAPAAPSPAPSDGQVGTQYSHSFTSATGSSAASFSVRPEDLPPGLSLSSTGVLSGTPTEAGEYTFTVTASNALFADSSQQFTITISPNTAPQATDDPYATEEDEPLTVGAAEGVLANDTDAEEDTLSAELVDDVANGKLALASDGSFTYTPNADFKGTDTFTYKANDGTVDSASSATVTITVNPVNDAPSFTKGANQTVNEDAAAQTVTGWATAISAGPANESDQTLTFTVTNNKNALFSSQPAIAPNGTLTYTPAANAKGTATVSVTLKDSGGTANSGVNTSEPVTFTITINPVDDAPRVAVAEGGSCSGTGVGATMNLTVADVDTAAGSLALSATSSNRTLVPSANISFSGSGHDRTMTLRAAEGQSGSATIEITLSDGKLKSTEIVSVKVGTNGANTITGTEGTDMLFGLDGVDVMNGLGANDLLCSGGGVDALSGDNGDDTLFGAQGKDLLRGSNGDDRLLGGGEDDRLFGDKGADRLGGGSGADRFSGGAGQDGALDFSPSQGDTRDNTLEML